MLGDVLTSTIIADQLRIKFPDAQIDFLIASAAQAMVENHPSIDRTILVEHREMHEVGGLVTLSRKLKNSNYDALIDVYGKNNSALLAVLSGIPKRVGYKKWFSFLSYTTAIENKPRETFPHTSSSLGSRMLLCQPFVKQIDNSLTPRIYLTEGEKKWGIDWLKTQGIDPSRTLTMVSVLGSSGEKTLPFDHMARLLDEYIQKTGSQLLFNYIPSQKQFAHDIYQQCQPQTQSNIFIDAFAPSLRDFLKITVHCHAVIGNEGGAMNMAKAMGVPTFSIFSPWISKTSWNIKEDGDQHVSVHLKDFRPELYHGKKVSSMRSQQALLYSQFLPAMYQNQLEQFIDTNLFR
jgi:heptosyltransferase-2